MESISGSAFTALLGQADVSQAAFARLTGVSPRQVNKWCRGRAAVPRWAAILALALRELSTETLAILHDELTAAVAKPY
ncbi:helix-turn-helix transcriptional regulator [Acidiphilium acidophilum]|uniref:helix-turn-helix domain-containing protein n=1 Tax=Acidiphilium acidophilum TaxID=76588 RepID=UPI002E8E77CF|nr:helix-turn-helix transcriptional regulator [Acidiphilium acidophilum]